DSPNRFIEYDDLSSLFSFMNEIREHTGKPVGIKIVIGGRIEADALAKHIKESGQSPDFITIDGGEGGTGASYQELADSVGLPIKKIWCSTASEGDCIRQVVYPRPHRHCPSDGSRSCSYCTWIYDYCGLYSNVEVPFQCLSGWSSYNRP